MGHNASTCCSATYESAEGQADDVEQLPDPAPFTDKNCSEQNLVDPDGIEGQGDDMEQLLDQNLSADDDFENVDSVASTERLQSSASAMTPNLTEHILAKKRLSKEDEINDESEDLKSVLSTRPSENDLQELNAQEMFMLRSYAPTEVPIPMMCSEVSYEQHV